MTVRDRRTLRGHGPLVSTGPGRRPEVDVAGCAENACQIAARYGLEGCRVSLLEVHNVSISFDAVRVLDDLSFALEPGELRFLIGPNGAGNTTLIDGARGKTRPHTGR